MPNTGIYTFDVEADQRAEAANAELEGPRFNTSQEGSTHEPGPTSITTDVPGNAEAMRDAQENPPVEVEETPRTGEMDYLKQQLGKQGNELGELRKEAAQAAIMRDRIQQMETQLQTQQATQSTPEAFDIFRGIPEEQMLSSPMERQAQNTFAVNLSNVLEQRLVEMNNNLSYTAVKAASGVTDAEEASLTTEYPFLNDLQGASRAKALGQMAASSRKAADAPNQVAKQVANQTAQVAAQKDNYVESSSGVSADASEALQSAGTKLMREIDSGKFKDAKDIEARMRKLGIGRVDEWGRQS